MTIYLLKDLEDNSADAVIIAKKSTTKDIEKAISKAKKIDAYTWEDIINALPSDCEIYDRWNDLKEIYY